MTAVIITNKRTKVDVLKNVECISENKGYIFISVDEYPGWVSHKYKAEDIDEIKLC